MNLFMKPRIVYIIILKRRRPCPVSSLEYDVLSINEHSPRQSADIHAR